ncbi:hypothetical protein GpartN1_g4765.t1 [Galdieria partita]|uniref:DNA (cytosine-5-)-methyltransferase n=1 Tax=Galdieria partita TaxID=83374 RepID=A0A9C7PYM7_9RHOD|nr:hypothetical protein GpartN1_g4765.t1 [Galdieria partita]
MRVTTSDMTTYTNSSISPISIKDLIYSSSPVWNKEPNRRLSIHTSTDSQPSDSDKDYDETWQPNRKDNSYPSYEQTYRIAKKNISHLSTRWIRKAGPDGSYYDCDSCAAPKGGWQKYWKDILSTSVSLKEPTKKRTSHNRSALSDSSSESCCSDDEENDWLGDTLICCEKCPITLHFACVCPPLDQNNLKDIWLCASCEQQQSTSRRDHSLLLLSSSTAKDNCVLQTSFHNIQYQISSWNWLNEKSLEPFSHNHKDQSLHPKSHHEHSFKYIFSQISQSVGYRNTTEFTPQMIVFSAFDGIAAARLALQRLGVIHVRYYASEIDAHAMQVAHTRFPDIIALGDIRQVCKRDIPEGVDLMIGGSPCQSLSRLGRQQGIQSGPSSLFFEYVRLLKEWKPRYFLLENVASMNAYDKQIITNALGVEPILVDAARFSAGIRYRYYWTNIPNAKRIWTLEEKANCYLQDILVDHARAQYPKAYTITTNNYAPRAFDNRFNTVWYNDQEKRGLNIIEAERILGFPDHYTECVKCSSDAQSFRTRWKLLGNSFCVPVIEAFCSFLLDSIVTHSTHG